jgi:hypothetical protein
VVARVNGAAEWGLGRAREGRKEKGASVPASGPGPWSNVCGSKTNNGNRREVDVLTGWPGLR